MGLKANADGSGAIQVGGSDAITITSGLNTTFAGTATVAGTAVYPLVASTVQTAPPTVPQYFQFTGIPSWVDRVTVMFSGVSTSGTSNIQLQIGPSGGVETSGYTGYVSRLASASNPTAVFSGGFLATESTAAANTYSGSFVFTLVSSNQWICNGQITGTNATFLTTIVVGAKTLSGALDRIRITTVGGSDTFDAGSINILYE